MVDCVTVSWEIPNEAKTLIHLGGWAVASMPRHRTTRLCLADQHSEEVQVAHYSRTSVLALQYTQTLHVNLNCYQW